MSRGSKICAFPRLVMDVSILNLITINENKIGANNILVKSAIPQLETSEFTKLFTIELDEKSTLPAHYGV